MLKMPTYKNAYESFERDLALARESGTFGLKATKSGWKLVSASRSYKVDTKNLVITVVNRVSEAVTGTLGYTESYTLSLSSSTLKNYLRNLH